ncbi:WD40-repeat-containing domain protein [Lasiosphaeria miniovina]|uniref:WD40-repeat-containing domain protein n=1 Tax=Lasiosphaeria miniovina TaxID=1954250 RepID=A0AA40A5Y6_9PEZI|nr:WD40-repeat-containing domain protein [Lasiosphaeria miniovina]KAK0709768.1 WD40-repeat-containing domain protein [Lasiosphaeria miniovina]
MKLSNPGTVPVYTIAGPSTARPLPDWLARRRKRSSKYDPENQNNFELLQEFEFEEASNCVRVSEDGNWIMSSGTYKPQFHVHSTQELSLSFARHTKSENTTFLLLSSDYSKSLHLQSDRSLEFHTPMGCHYETRLPRFGRDLAYIRQNTEVLVPAVGLSSDGSGMGEVFRLDLERGQYLRPWQINVGEDEAISGLQGSINVGAVNVAAVAESTHGLCAFGTSISTVEFFDPRTKGRVAVLGGHDGEVTALDFSKDGLSLALGTAHGQISTFDLRNPRPLLKKDQGMGLPIQSLIHMTTPTEERKLLSADKRIIKIWDEHSGDLWTSIEPMVDINYVAHCPDSGMILTANEGKQMHSFFIPNLGLAPRWCHFVDNLVHEMENETRTETYDNFKFLTVPELKALSLGHLVGKTNLLRPYMHGYFVAAKLYDQARLIANPYIWEEERAKRIREKVEKERASRIRGVKKVKVNQKLADKMSKRQEIKQKADIEDAVLGDSRFGKLFEDEDFKVDETSWEFRSLNPSTQVPGRDGAPPAAVEDSGGGSSDGGGNAGDAGDEVFMQVSSSRVQGGRAKDTAIGSRAQKYTRTTKTRPGEVVGEKNVTFVPESKSKDKAPPPAPADKRSDARRSASTNTFRRL